MTTDPPALFVYGTLMRGEMNHALVGCRALAVEHAWTHGLLYDVGDFPALLPGEGHVHGELVQLDTAGLAAVLPLIDRLEGYDAGNEAGSFFLRRVIQVTSPVGDCPAIAYFYNPEHPALPALDYLPLIASGTWRHDREMETFGAWVGRRLSTGRR
ncbi:MAG: gamma-glutamylcyclotransferase family protein [Chloroflexota bacterium]